MQGAGSALMGIGSARGDDRAVQAAELAISSPLLEASIDGAHGVLLSIQGGSDLGLFEINEAARLVQEAAHPEANIIFGAVIDDALGDEVRVTVIAAGFDGGGPVRRGDDRALGQIAGSTGRQQAQEQPRQQTYQPSQQPVRSAPPVQSQPAPAPRVPAPSVPSHQVQQQPQAEPQQAPEPARQQEPVARPPRTVTFDDNDDLDVPDFLK
jgi:cell division protein FtsZ